MIRQSTVPTRTRCIFIFVYSYNFNCKNLMLKTTFGASATQFDMELPSGSARMRSGSSEGKLSCGVIRHSFAAVCLRGFRKGVSYQQTVPTFAFLSNGAVVWSLLFLASRGVTTILRMSNVNAMVDGALPSIRHLHPPPGDEDPPNRP